MVTGGYRLGIDIGGTFTDFVMVDEESGELITAKVPSQPLAPASAVRDGIQQLVTEHDISADSIRYFVHGTTIALNTLIQRGGAPTGLLITRGFGDVLEIGRLRLPNPNDFLCDRTEPLVPRYWVREIGERILANGDELEPVDIGELKSAVEELRAESVKAIAISFLHSYRNDEHERQAIEYLRAEFPDIYFASSAATWPEQREYERTLVTVMNSYLGNQLKTYFSNLHTVTGELGVDTTLFTTKSNGGLMTAQSASYSPVETLLSGPASGVVGALHIAELSGFKQVISLDMGGTSADVAILDGSIPYSTEGKVGDYPVIMPAIEISSIGAGGGSIAWTDQAGVLKVGPQSAGANPGPVCYGRGGTEPTVTDAYVTLGIVEPKWFLGGRMQLDAEAASAGLERLGERLSQSATEAAASVLEVVTANMYAQMLPLMAQKGVDPRDFALVAYGGAGPTQACFLAKELGITHVIVPPSPGLLCAFGSLVSDLKSDFVATLNARTDETTFEDLEASYAELESRAIDWLREQVGELGAYTLERTADMRYRGQSFEINVTLKGDDRQAASLDDIRDFFHNDYEIVFSQSDRVAPVEIVNIRATITGEIPKPDFAKVPMANGTGEATPARTQDIFLDGSWTIAGIYQRHQLRASNTIDGPAVIEQTDTTVLLPPGVNARVDEWANIIVEVNP